MGVSCESFERKMSVFIGDSKTKLIPRECNEVGQFLYSKSGVLGFKVAVEVERSSSSA